MQLETFPGVFSEAEQLLQEQPEPYRGTEMCSELLACNPSSFGEPGLPHTEPSRTTAVPWLVTQTSSSALLREGFNAGSCSPPEFHSLGGFFHLFIPTEATGLPGNLKATNFKSKPF